MWVSNRKDLYNLSTASVFPASGHTVADLYSNLRTFYYQISGSCIYRGFHGLSGTFCFPEFLTDLESSF